MPPIFAILRRHVTAARLAVLLLVAWTLWSFAPAVPGPFFFDDEHFIQKNAFVHSLAHLRELYTTTVTQGAGIPGNFYRPNQQLIFALLYAAVGDSTPVPYHLVALGLHVLNGLLLLGCLLALDLGLWAALLGAAVFLLHPVQTEAVCYISGLADPLALAGQLGALLVLVRGLRAEAAGGRYGWWRVPVFALLQIFAHFSKESAVVAAPLALLTTLAFWRLSGRRPGLAAWTTTAVSGVLAIAYTAAKMTVFNFYGGSFGLAGGNNPYMTSVLVRVTTFVNLLWDYAVLVFYPKVLNYEKPYRAFLDLLTWRGAFGVATLALAVLVLACARKAPRLALGVGVVAAGFLPYIGIVPLNAMFLEHWLYVPMVGVALLVATLAAGLKRWVTARPSRARALTAGTGWVLVLVVLGLASLRTRARAADWADVEAFYLNELAQGGESTRILNNLGMVYADRGDLDKAVVYYRLAINQPRSVPAPQPHHNLARVLAALGRRQDAALELREALRIDHGFIYSLIFLRDLYASMGDLPRANLVDAAARSVQAGGTYDFTALDAALYGGPSR